MPFPLISIAIPVLHSSGAWIAYAGTGYLAGTLSSTWIGAFILGNSGLLASLGLVSAAGLWGATTGGVAAAAGAASAAISTGLGTGLTAIGLGSAASALGIAPVATFLGLTPLGWGIAGVSTAALAALGLKFKKRVMVRINEERSKGGLPAINLSEILAEIRAHERNTLHSLLSALAKTNSSILLAPDGDSVTIGLAHYSLGRLRYLVHPDGCEEIVFITKTGRKKRILLIKPPSGQTI